MPIFNKPLSEYKRFMEELDNYDECEDEELDLFLEDANLDKLKALLGDDYYKDVYVPFKNKIASKIKVGEDENGNPIMGENPDLKLKRTDYLLDTYSENPQALKDLIANYKTKSGEIKEAKKGAKYLGENGEYKCYFVFTYPAAKYYGENTTWCITGRYKGREEEGEKFFNDYINDEGLDGGYYFFIHKTNPRRKYALLQQVDKKDKKHPLKIHSVWSALNSPLTLDRLPIFPMVKEIPELKDVYKDVDIENSDHIKDRDRKSLEHDILISCQLPKENAKDAIRNLKEILEGDAYKDYKFDLNNIKDEYGYPPLFKACMNDYTEVAKLLIKHGADVNFKDNGGETLLFIACDNDNTELVKLLLEQGADKSVNIKDAYGRTPLYEACLGNNTELVKLLLEHGADVNLKDEYGFTPLFKACSKDNTELVKLLLEHGADVNVKDEYEETPLYLACYKNKLNIAKLLIEHNADINSKNKDGYTPLFKSCINNYTEVAKLLIESGADVNSKSEYGRTPLYQACFKDNTELVKLLLEQGADKSVNIKDDYGTTPLYCACSNNNTELIKLLIEHNADINSKDKYGNTPLNFVCSHRYTKVAKLLIEHGADVNSKNNRGDIPLSWVCSNSDIELAKLLIEHGADVNIKHKYGETPLYWACKKNNTELVKLLLEHGAWKDLDVNNLPDYITNNKQIEDLVLSYLNKNKGRNESIKIRRLYRKYL